jgi:hypothetical protein
MVIAGFPGLFGAGAGPATPSNSDRRIVEALTAPEETHRRLVQTARQVPTVLDDPEGEPLVSRAQLYGSLSLDMAPPEDFSSWKQDWASYYINQRSDVDFVVEMRRGVSPQSVAQRLVAKGNWRMESQVQVHKFATTQFTLVGSFDEEGNSQEGASSGSSEVYLDITAIKSKLHFDRFKARQEAFRQVFMTVRQNMQELFALQGALAFDAYIHLLKAFAAKVPGNTMTGFQATCIGLFVLQIKHFRLKPSQSLALALFEGFLRFCGSFYGDLLQPGMGWMMPGFRQCAIDLSGGRFMPRGSENWRSELYFYSVEDEMHIRPDERVNVTHSLDPAKVSEEAHNLLSRAFSVNWC